ncbi:MAG: branched-chain amino acid ABC transporter substrate-binding protein [Deferrisomatales bacterium]|nr:branched-chain amino acid ABC transporter substrate-binding protein [Deferrisomatales bacterium]
MIQRRIFRSAAAAGAAVLALLLSGTALAKEPIRLGVVGPHTGDLASYGIPSIRAARLVVDEVNARGGVLGRPVQLLVEDDECKPEKAANIAAKLVSSDVHVVLGHVCSGATKAALGTYRDAKVVAMSPSATNPELTQSGDYPNFYRTIASDDLQAKLGVDFALGTLGKTKIAVLHDKGDYGKGFADFAKKFVDESGGKGQVVLFEGITPGAVDYSAVVQKVNQRGAEALIYGGYHPEASKLVTGMKRRRMDIAFIAADGVKDDTFINVAKEFAEGVYASGPKDTSKFPLFTKASEDHRRAHGEDPGAFFTEAYAATLALLNAIEKAGSTDYAAVEAALRNEWVETPVGRISFDERGDAKGVGFSMYQVQSGVYAQVQE